MRFRMIDPTLTESIENVLNNISAVYIVDDARKVHFTTDEIITEEDKHNNDVDYYPEEQLLDADDEYLKNLPIEKIHSITNTELLDRICSIDRNLLTYSQKEILQDKYKVVSTRTEGSMKMANGLINKIQKLDSNHLMVEPTSKNREFQNKYNLDNEDLLNIIKQFVPEEYNRTLKATYVKHIGDNLFEFISPDDIIMNKNGEKTKLDMYIKIDYDESLNDTILFISLHEDEEKPWDKLGKERKEARRIVKQKEIKKKEEKERKKQELEKQKAEIRKSIANYNK